MLALPEVSSLPPCLWQVCFDLHGSQQMLWAVEQLSVLLVTLAPGSALE